MAVGKSLRVAWPGPDAFADDVEHRSAARNGGSRARGEVCAHLEPQ